MVKATIDGDEIKFQTLDPFGNLTLTKAEWIAAAMAGQWVMLPTRWMTREEFEKEFPSEEVKR